MAGDLEVAMGRAEGLLRQPRPMRALEVVGMPGHPRGLRHGEAAPGKRAYASPWYPPPLMTDVKPASANIWRARPERIPEAQ